MPLELPPGMATPRPDRAPPPKHWQVFAVIAVTVGAIVLAAWGVLWGIGRLVLLVPPEWERQLGQTIVAQLEEEAENGPVQAELNRLLDRLEEGWPDRGEFPFELLFVPERDVVNAFAVPGNYVVLYGGLVAAAESENELAMVLGHELGHFSNRDHMRSLGRSISIPIALSILVGDIGGLQVLVSQQGLQAVSAQFSQRQEQMADEFGLKLLEREYGHAGGATAFFDRLDTGWSPIDFLASHPAPASRVRHLEQQIERQRLTVQELTPLPGAIAAWVAEGEDDSARNAGQK